MARTNSIELIYRDTAGQVIDVTYTKTGNSEVSFDGSIGIQTDEEYNLAFDKDFVVAYLLYSDVACTVKTNSSSSPGNTISLSAGVPKVYSAEIGGSSLFTADVTSIFLTNAAAGNLKIRVLLALT